MFQNAQQYREAVQAALAELPADRESVYIRAKGTENIFEVPRKIAAQCIAERSADLATEADMELHRKQLEQRKAAHEAAEKRRADSAGFRVIVNNVAVPAADVTVEKPDAKAKK